jgi:undecaprenyl-diphosphatase
MRRLLQHPFVRRHLSLAAVLRAMRQPVFLTGLMAFVCLWGFAELADAVDEQSTQKFDEWILSSLREAGDPTQMVGPAWLEQSMRDVTALGGETVLSLITAIVCLYLSLAGRHALSLTTAVAIIGGTVVTFALKDVFDRPRPNLVPHILVSVTSHSFPSGHAMASAIVYLTLGTMVAEAVDTWRLKAYVIAVAIFLMLIVGTTRVFLGVHYPTDVLAGWAAGFVWAYGCRTLVRLTRFWNRTRHTPQGKGSVPPK